MATSKNSESASGTLDHSIRAILDAMQKQNETFTKQIDNLTRRLEETQKVANEENKKRTKEIEFLGRNMSKVTLGDDLLTDFSGLTANTDTHSVMTARDVMPNTSRMTEAVHTEQHTTEQYANPNLKAKDAIKCIPQINGEDDIGVEEFIREVREMRAMCSEQSLLLKMIKIEKITGKAATAIRNVTVKEYTQLYDALRRNVATQASVREQQDQLREIRQRFDENVQSYIIRFRRTFNKLQYSITNEYTDELTRRAMNDRILQDSVIDFIRGLKTEIGQILLANPPYNIPEAEKKAADIERYFREDRMKRFRPIEKKMTTFNPRPNPTPHPRSTQPIQSQQTQIPRSFSQMERTPLAQRSQMKCFKCGKIGHIANNCQNFQSRGPQERAPPRINNIEATIAQEENYESIPSPEDYQLYELDQQGENNEHSLWTQEQESTYSNEAQLEQEE